MADDAPAEAPTAPPSDEPLKLRALLEEWQRSLQEVRRSIEGVDEELVAIGRDLMFGSGQPGEIAERVTAAADRVRADAAVLEERERSVVEVTTEAFRRLAERLSQLDAERDAVAGGLSQELAALREEERRLHEETRADWAAALSPIARALPELVSAIGERLSALESSIPAAVRQQFAVVERDADGEPRRVDLVPEQLESSLLGLQRQLRTVSSEAIAPVVGSISALTEEIGERFERLDSVLGRRQKSLEKILRDRLESPEALVERFRRGQDELVSRFRKEVAATIGNQLESSLRGELERLDPIASGIEELRSSWERAVEGLLERFGALERELPAVGERVEAVRHELGPSVEERLQEVSREVRAELEQTVSAVREQLETVRGEMSGHNADLAEGLARVERLADAVETIGRRRGFRKLVEGERRFEEEQASLVERLMGTGDAVAGVLAETRDRIDGAVRLLSAAAERNQQDAEATAALRESLEALPGLVQDRLAEALERDRGSLERAVAAQLSKLRRQMASADDDQLGELREEIRALRGTVEGWAKPKTAPRLAQQLRALERKFEGLEASVQDTLAKEVASRVRASVDRRLKAFLDEISENASGS